VSLTSITMHCCSVGVDIRHGAWGYAGASEKHSSCQDRATNGRALGSSELQVEFEVTGPKGGDAACVTIMAEDRVVLGTDDKVCGGGAGEGGDIEAHAPWWPGSWAISSAWVRLWREGCSQYDMCML
jgi:hypothetical protein